MWKTAMVLLAVMLAPWSHAEETTLAKSCIFAAAAHLPTVPGLVIKSSSTLPASAIPVGAADPSLRQWKVTLEVEAAGQAALYEALCNVGTTSPPEILQLLARDLPKRPPEPPQNQKK
ncbi:MAG: hypothetical protein JWM77_2006 [Rhodospirillales bacterium]|nr:hypothetical protein [Rhodospirillales bacterium]